MKNEGATAVGRLATALEEVNGKLKEATDTKDAIKLTCVNEVLKQLKAIVGIANQANVNLQSNIAASKESEADQEFAKVITAQNIGMNLRAESEKCLGQLAWKTAENLQKIVEPPKDLPAGDLAKWYPPALTTSYTAPGSP